MAKLRKCGSNTTLETGHSDITQQFKIMMTTEAEKKEKKEKKKSTKSTHLPPILHEKGDDENNH
jgi:hypothetical protein